MRKHPVVVGLILLAALGTVVYFMSYQAGIQSGGAGSKRFSLADKIGVVPVEGVITDSLEIAENLEEFGKNRSIVAVVVRIDSPGGGVAASQEIYEAITALKKKKKVVASLGSVAASGGLLIACAADKIVANPGTITGSISAVMQFANVEELMKKIGVKSSVVKSGPYKDIGSPMREMSPEERIIIQDLIDDIYNQFIDVIVRDRKLPRQQVIAIGDGRVFSGRKAMEYGLVDQLGDLTAAAKLAGVLAGSHGGCELVYPPKKRSSILSYVMESAADLFVRSVRQKAQTWGGAGYLYIP
ncbi:MAG: signal peptide peptidase SppA [Smithella sp.]|jgi:protease-4|nr:signal peptide peptidase SppA [Smithellaceae bacterium]NLA42344.1 signal peptide peptidase SppA [Smithella sp.]